MNSDFVEQYVFYGVVIFVLCLAVSLLVMAWISDDKENSILPPVWSTFFGSGNTDTDTPTPPPSDKEKG